MFRFPDSFEPESEAPKPERRRPMDEPPTLTFTEQIIDEAVSFAVAYRTRLAWRDWAEALVPRRRAVFQAMRDGARDAEGESLPNLESLPHELRIMLEEAFRVWEPEEK
jgi:hypothetical protein